MWEKKYSPESKHFGSLENLEITSLEKEKNIVPTFILKGSMLVFLEKRHIIQELTWNQLHTTNLEHMMSGLMPAWSIGKWNRNSQQFCRKKQKKHEKHQPWHQDLQQPFFCQIEESITVGFPMFFFSHLSVSVIHLWKWPFFRMGFRWFRGPLHP